MFILVNREAAGVFTDGRPERRRPDEHGAAGATRGSGQRTGQALQQTAEVQEDVSGEFHCPDLVFFLKSFSIDVFGVTCVEILPSRKTTSNSKTVFDHNCGNKGHL